MKKKERFIDLKRHLMLNRIKKSSSSSTCLIKIFLNHIEEKQMKSKRKKNK